MLCARVGRPLLRPGHLSPAHRDMRQWVEAANPAIAAPVSVHQPGPAQLGPARVFVRPGSPVFATKGRLRSRQLVPCRDSHPQASPDSAKAACSAGIPLFVRAVTLPARALTLSVRAATLPACTLTLPVRAATLPACALPLSARFALLPAYASLLSVRAMMLTVCRVLPSVRDVMLLVCSLTPWVCDALLRACTRLLSERAVMRPVFLRGLRYCLHTPRYCWCLPCCKLARVYRITGHIHSGPARERRALTNNPGPTEIQVKNIKKIRVSSQQCIAKSKQQGLNRSHSHIYDRPPSTHPLIYSLSVSHFRMTSIADLVVV